MATQTNTLRGSRHGASGSGSAGRATASACLGIMVLLSVGACSIPFGTDTAHLALQLVAPRQAGTTGAEQVEIARIGVLVQGPDMAPVRRTLTPDSTRLELPVPAGAGRRVSVTAFDAAGRIRYRGSSVVDLVEGETTIVSLLLEVVPLPSSDASIIRFSVLRQNNSGLLADRAGIIDLTNNTVSVAVSASVPDSTLSSLIATFEVADGARVTVGGVVQESGVTANDFTGAGGVTYRVTATDDSFEDYVVSVTRSISNVPPGFATYSVADTAGVDVTRSVEFDGDVVRVVVPFGTNVATLVPSFTFDGPVGGVRADWYNAGTTTGEPTTGALVTSGLTGHHFGGPVVYTITSQDGGATRKRSVYVYYDDTGIDPDGAGPEPAPQGILIPEAGGSNPGFPQRLPALADFDAATTADHTTSSGSSLGYVGMWIYDIGYDAYGGTYLGNFDEGAIGPSGAPALRRYNRVPLAAAEANGESYTYTASGMPQLIEFLAIDRLRDRIYVSAGGSPTFYQIDVADTSAVPVSIPGGDIFGTPAGNPMIFGLDVSPSGYLYLIAKEEMGAGFRLVKYFPPTSTVVATFDLTSGGPLAGAFVDSPSFHRYNDVHWREGYIYLTNDVGPSNPAIFKFDENLNFVGSFGTEANAGGQTDPTPGAFLNPVRFTAVMNKRMVIMDEGRSPTFPLQNRLVAFDEYEGGSFRNWRFYGTFGSGPTQFGMFVDS